MNLWTFVHPPKTAGSAVKKSLEIGLNGPASRCFRVIGHLPAYADDHERSFAIRRNPYDRAVSLFCWLSGYQHLSDPVRGFRNWAQRLDLPSDQRMDARVSSARVYASRPQCVWLCHWASDEVAVTKLLRFENLEYDWTEFTIEAFGIPVDLKVTNKANLRLGCPGIAYWYDAPTCEAVYQHYARDFDVLGYSRSLPP